jgi:hypothetical protein
MATTARARTMVRHEARVGPASLDEMEDECRALGKTWARAYRSWGRPYAHPIAELFQRAIWELHTAGRQAAAFHIANQARAMAREGVAG